MRRLAATLLVLAGGAGGLAACGQEPGPAQQKRVEFLEKHDDLSDPELAAVCPSLYPSDFLTKPKKYRYDEKDRGYKPNAAERAAAKAAGCTSQGTKPKER